MQRKILTVDIGNTCITFGLIDKLQIMHKWKISTNEFLSNRKTALNKLNYLKRIKISAIMICSVVPNATLSLKKLLKKLLGLNPIIVGRDKKVSIKCLYNSRQIGQDRLVGAYAASKLYGRPIIVIDFGTALTFDLVSKKNVYLGGVIVPGISMSLESLYQKTALLPKIKFAKCTTPIIGQNTHDSILSGICFGYASLCDGIIKLLQKKIGKCKVIATGGQARIITKYCKHINKIDDDLMLRGLTMLYYKGR